MDADVPVLSALRDAVADLVEASHSARDGKLTIASTHVQRLEKVLIACLASGLSNVHDLWTSISASRWPPTSAPLGRSLIDTVAATHGGTDEALLVAWLRAALNAGVLGRALTVVLPQASCYSPESLVRRSSLRFLGLVAATEGLPLSLALGGTISSASVVPGPGPSVAASPSRSRAPSDAGSTSSSIVIPPPQPPPVIIQAVSAGAPCSDINSTRGGPSLKPTAICGAPLSALVHNPSVCASALTDWRLSVPDLLLEAVRHLHAAIDWSSASPTNRSSSTAAATVAAASDEQLCSPRGPSDWLLWLLSAVQQEGECGWIPAVAMDVNAFVARFERSRQTASSTTTTPPQPFPLMNTPDFGLDSVTKGYLASMLCLLECIPVPVPPARLRGGSTNTAGMNGSTAPSSASVASSKSAAKPAIVATTMSAPPHPSSTASAALATSSAAVAAVASAAPASATTAAGDITTPRVSADSATDDEPMSARAAADALQACVNVQPVAHRAMLCVVVPLLSRLAGIRPLDTLQTLQTELLSATSPRSSTVGSDAESPAPDGTLRLVAELFGQAILRLSGEASAVSSAAAANRVILRGPREAYGTLIDPAGLAAQVQAAEKSVVNAEGTVSISARRAQIHRACVLLRDWQFILGPSLAQRRRWERALWRKLHTLRATVAVLHEPATASTAEGSPRMLSAPSSSAAEAREIASARAPAQDSTSISRDGVRSNIAPPTASAAAGEQQQQQHPVLAAPAEVEAPSTVAAAAATAAAAAREISPTRTMSNSRSVSAPAHGSIIDPRRTAAAAAAAPRHPEFSLLSLCVWQHFCVHFRPQASAMLRREQRWQRRYSSLTTASSTDAALAVRDAVVLAVAALARAFHLTESDEEGSALSPSLLRVHSAAALHASLPQDDRWHASAGRGSGGGRGDAAVWTTCLRVAALCPHFWVLANADVHAGAVQQQNSAAPLHAHAGLSSTSSSPASTAPSSPMLTAAAASSSASQRSPPRDHVAAATAGSVGSSGGGSVLNAATDRSSAIDGTFSGSGAVHTDANGASGHTVPSLLERSSLEPLLLPSTSVSGSSNSAQPHSFTFTSNTSTNSGSAVGLSRSISSNTSTPRGGAESSSTSASSLTPLNPSSPIVLRRAQSALSPGTPSASAASRSCIVVASPRRSVVSLNFGGNPKFADVSAVATGGAPVTSLNFGNAAPMLANISAAAPIATAIYAPDTPTAVPLPAVEVLGTSSTAATAVFRSARGAAAAADDSTTPSASSSQSSSRDSADSSVLSNSGNGDAKAETPAAAVEIDADVAPAEISACFVHLACLTALIMDALWQRHTDPGTGTCGLGHECCLTQLQDATSSPSSCIGPSVLMHPPPPISHLRCFVSRAVRIVIVDILPRLAASAASVNEEEASVARWEEGPPPQFAIAAAAAAEPLTEGPSAAHDTVAAAHSLTPAGSSAAHDAAVAVGAILSPVDSLEGAVGEIPSPVDSSEGASAAARAVTAPTSVNVQLSRGGRDHTTETVSPPSRVAEYAADSRRVISPTSPRAHADNADSHRRHHASGSSRSRASTLLRVNDAPAGWDVISAFEAWSVGVSPTDGERAMPAATAAAEVNVGSPRPIPPLPTTATASHTAPAQPVAASAAVLLSHAPTASQVEVGGHALSHPPPQPLTQSFVSRLRSFSVSGSITAPAATTASAATSSFLHVLGFGGESTASTTSAASSVPSAPPTTTQSDEPLSFPAPAPILRSLPLAMLPAPRWSHDSETTSILSTWQERLLAASLPAAAAGDTWVLAYSLARHGASLSTLVARSREYERSIVVMQDETGTVFGGYAPESWTPPSSRRAASSSAATSGRYFGNGTSFVFSFGDDRSDASAGVSTGGGTIGASAAVSVTSTGGAPTPRDAAATTAVVIGTVDASHGSSGNSVSVAPSFNVWRWSRDNTYFQLLSVPVDSGSGGASSGSVGRGGIAMGGGGSFAWFLDNELCDGYSGGCATFHSPPLCGSSPVFGGMPLQQLQHHRRQFTGTSSTSAEPVEGGFASVEAEWHTSLPAQHFTCIGIEVIGLAPARHHLTVLP